MNSISKLAGAALVSALVSLSAQASSFTVEAGKSRAIKLSAKADSVVIGNPNIADVAVHDGKLMFVTGKSFGTTNLMIFDSQGNTLFSKDVVVTANTATWVSVKRAGSNFTYDCAPACRPTLSAGDDAAHYENVAEQLLLQKELNDEGD
ncbi:MAG: pilus assembly protein N-terminal domain-containing protein [Pseudomonadota bacterium]